ncbi:MAG: potassium transporter [Planctomycetaceae bacterium]|jgi:trk system potassium uptake protein TrkH|nr:potassium transporter [Planctomycetaceae bacterium]MDP7275564.1 TrkH family potassium uptake protein [Planctomycetaceae bacterium]
MNWFLLCRMLGMLGVLVGGSMVFSLPWAFPACGEAETFEAAGFWGLLTAIGCSLAVGGGLSYIGRHDSGTILRKEALAIVGLGWLLAGCLGSLPFLFSGVQRAAIASDGHEIIVTVGVADALFESVSGFTTTGASVLTDLEAGATGMRPLVPRCILFWRSFTHWLGGMGIIVLFVAILGQLGAGGKALLRREVPGPMSSTVRPRVQEAAMVMWAIYVAISGLLALLLAMEGMSVFDALCHTFGTMATGGFSTHNASVGGFGSVVIESTIVIFMIVAGTNFSLFHLAVSDRQPLKTFRQDPEFCVYLFLLLSASVFLGLSIFLDQQVDDLFEAVRISLFQTTSIMTTTGFATADFGQWSDFSQGLLLLLMFVGGCAGSTGGGLKVIRFILFAKIVRLEVEQAFRPNVVRPLRLAGTPIDKAQRHQVVVYFCLVLLICVISWMLLLVIEPGDAWHGEESNRLLDTASAVAATLNNIGPGLGVFGPERNYAMLAAQSKLLLTVLMLLGRLELFAILVLFVPSFWRSR